MDFLVQTRILILESKTFLLPIYRAVDIFEKINTLAVIPKMSLSNSYEA